jgi:hypothetical protein
MGNSMRHDYFLTHLSLIRCNGIACKKVFHLLFAWKKWLAHQ